MLAVNGSEGWLKFVTWANRVIYNLCSCFIAWINVLPLKRINTAFFFLTWCLSEWLAVQWCHTAFVCVYLSCSHLGNPSFPMRKAAGTSIQMKRGYFSESFHTWDQSLNVCPPPLLPSFHRCVLAKRSWLQINCFAFCQFWLFSLVPWNGPHS